MIYQYKQILNPMTGHFNNTMILRLPDNATIPFDPANTDYANFKEQILTGGAELQDADGNVMSPEVAQQFIATLP